MADQLFTTEGVGRKYRFCGIFGTLLHAAVSLSVTTDAD